MALHPEALATSAGAPRQEILCAGDAKQTRHYTPNQTLQTTMDSSQCTARLGARRFEVCPDTASSSGPCVTNMPHSSFSLHSSGLFIPDPDDLSCSGATRACQWKRARCFDRGHKWHPSHLHLHVRTCFYKPIRLQVASLAATKLRPVVLRRHGNGAMHLQPLVSTFQMLRDCDHHKRSQRHRRR